MLLSFCLFLMGGYILIRDAAFFLRHTETSATIEQIETPWDYKRRLKYYHAAKGEYISTRVKLKSSYKDQVDNFGSSVDIVYSIFFPKNVYIKSCKVPKAGILIIEIVFIVFVFISFLYGLDGLRKRKQ